MAQIQVSQGDCVWGIGCVTPRPSDPVEDPEMSGRGKMERWNGPMQSVILMLTNRKCYCGHLHRLVDIMNQSLLKVLAQKNRQPVNHWLDRCLFHQM